jgi:hypothetical protein
MAWVPRPTPVKESVRLSKPPASGHPPRQITETERTQRDIPTRRPRPRRSMRYAHRDAGEAVRHAGVDGERGPAGTADVGPQHALVVHRAACKHARVHACGATRRRMGASLNELGQLPSPWPGLVPHTTPPRPPHTPAPHIQTTGRARLRHPTCAPHGGVSHKTCVVALHAPGVGRARDVDAPAPVGAVGALAQEHLAVTRSSVQAAVACGGGCGWSGMRTASRCACTTYVHTRPHHAHPGRRPSPSGHPPSNVQLLSTASGLPLCTRAGRRLFSGPCTRS